ncbi:MAG: hypothetical protein QXL18_04020, partial [Candidatus Woesearchaeota archaeon]
VDAADGNDVRFLSLKSNPVTLDFQAVAVDSGADLTSMFFNGSSNSWTVTANIDTAVDIATRRPVDFDWLPDGSSGRLVWDTDTTGTTLSQRVCSPLCNSATTTISSYAGSGGWIKLLRNINGSNVAKILGLRFNSAFNIGSFYFNGSSYINYGDTVIASGDTINTYESYSLDFIKSKKQPLIINFVPPTDANNATITRTYSFVNVTVFPNYSTCYLNWSGNVYLMSENGNVRYYNKTGLFTGTEQYYVICNTSNVIEKTQIRTINIQTTFAINISLVFPDNGQTLNYPNIDFIFNVSHPLWNVNNCSLIINDAVVNTTTIFPVPQNTNITLSTYLISGNYNWSVNCTDEYGIVSSSQKRSLTVRIPPVINSVYINDYLIPEGEVILSAGSTRPVFCIVNVSDTFGAENINYTRATFYYYLNNSFDNDDYNVHYTNNNCDLNYTGISYKVFSCLFNVYYYANNGTWNCTAFAYNNQSVSSNLTNNTLINPLYALNVTDGLSFGNVESGFESSEIKANISNIGNMPINISVQGYAIYPGDAVGMNCSDGTNISIDSIRFSLTSTIYDLKNPLNGNVQNTSLKIQKQINTSTPINITYWQIKPNPFLGSNSRYCSGFIIFNAEAG